MADDFVIGTAGGDDLAFQRADPGGIGADQPLGAVEDGEAVVDGFQRIPEPAFGYHGGGMGAVEVFDEAQVLVFQRFGPG